MKKSELRELVREIVGGYEPDGKGNLVRHNDKFDSTKLNSILKKIVDRDNEKDTVSEEAANKVSIMLDDLTVDKIKEVFPNFGEKYGQLSFPNPNDSLTQVNSQESLERWKDGTREEYGNVEVVLYPEETIWFNKVKINNPEFIADKETSTKRKASWLDGEREAGRTGGLD